MPDSGHCCSCFTLASPCRYVSSLSYLFLSEHNRILAQAIHYAGQTIYKQECCLKPKCLPKSGILPEISMSFITKSSSQSSAYKQVFPQPAPTAASSACRGSGKPVAYCAMTDLLPLCHDRPVACYATDYCALTPDGSLREQSH